MFILWLTNLKKNAKKDQFCFQEDRYPTKRMKHWIITFIRPLRKQNWSLLALCRKISQLQNKQNETFSNECPIYIYMLYVYTYIISRTTHTTIMFLYVVILFYYLIGRALFHLKMQSFYCHDNGSGHVMILNWFVRVNFINNICI